MNYLNIFASIVDSNFTSLQGVVRICYANNAVNGPQNMETITYRECKDIARVSPDTK